jgi:hypothetical protein
VRADRQREREGERERQGDRERIIVMEKEGREIGVIGEHGKKIFERERLTAMQERENLLMAEIQRYPSSLHFSATTTDLTSVVSQRLQHDKYEVMAKTPAEKQQRVVEMLSHSTCPCHSLSLSLCLSLSLSLSLCLADHHLLRSR